MCSASLHFWGWQLIIVSAALTLPFGITKGKEYAELEWPIDLAIAVVWVGFFGVNFFMTLARRRERHMYVALWFYIATICTVAILHVFNNLVIPIGLWKSYSIYAGVQDAFMEWWYGHNAVAFFLTTPFLGMMYYFMPKAAERPVFSYRLSIVHFWSLVFIYIWAGPHHLHYTALPDWASNLGMLFSIMLWMPSWGGMINGLLTLRGAWNKVSTDPVLKFFVVAITFYGMSTFEGPLLSVKAVNSLSHYTDWTIAHVHAGTLGWVGFMSFGMMYWLLPRLFQTKLYSQKLATIHFWLGTVGILLYVIPIYVAGITEGLMWRAMNDQGQLLYPDFIETVRATIPDVVPPRDRRQRLPVQRSDRRIQLLQDLAEPPRGLQRDSAIRSGPGARLHRRCPQARCQNSITSPTSARSSTSSAPSGSIANGNACR